MSALQNLLVAKDELEKALRDEGLEMDVWRAVKDSFYVTDYAIRQMRREEDINLAWDYHYGLTDSLGE